MELVTYNFPAYTPDILEILAEADWFIHSYDIEDKLEIYNPSRYLYNSEFNGVKYTIHLDLNIYQYVLSAYKKNRKNQFHRQAIALMVFGKIADIMFEPTIAIYERLNYKEQCSNELIDDLALFRTIDNTDINELARFALGYTDEINLFKGVEVNREELKSSLTRYKRLKKWDSLYLCVLEITRLYFLDTSTNEEKIVQFLDWSHKDFMFSLVSLSSLIKLLGANPLPKLMKYKTNDSPEKRKGSLINMTWDLFLIDKYFEEWVKKTDKEEFIYVSNDKPFRELLELAISIQRNGGCKHLNELISQEVINEFSRINTKINNSSERKIDEVQGKEFKLYRDRLINQREDLLLS